MCPVCLSSVALVLGGATSAAALATLTGLRLRAVREKRGDNRIQYRGDLIMTTSRIEHSRVVSRADWLAEGGGVGSRESLILSAAKDLLPRPQEPAK